MSQEIIEGIQAIEKEKGIEEGILITALEDALRAAYKKTPGATRHAEVKLGGDGEFRVYGIDIPADIEVRLLEALIDLELVARAVEQGRGVIGAEGTGHTVISLSGAARRAGRRTARGSRGTEPPRRGPRPATRRRSDR